MTTKMNSKIQNLVTSSTNSEFWDSIVSKLFENHGIVTIDIESTELQQIHAHGFDVARRIMDSVKKATNTSSKDNDPAGTHQTQPIKIQTIGPNAVSAHATGYHFSGLEQQQLQQVGNRDTSEQWANNLVTNSLSRYNEYREGLVFSDGEMISFLSDGTTNGITTMEFEDSMTNLFSSLHGIANCILLALERKLKFATTESQYDNCRSGWFQQNFGPTDTSSQWHVKRFVSKAMTQNSNLEGVILPMHTDPSLISVVIHDCPGKNHGGFGLQYFGSSRATNEEVCNNKSSNVWQDVPYHGHAVATIFVGSLLSYVTGGVWPAMKHRVIYQPTLDNMKQRTAATLFVRPQGSSKLRLPPSPVLLETYKIKELKQELTFDAWNSRVSKNYMKPKKQHKQKQQQ